MTRRRGLARLSVVLPAAFAVVVSLGATSGLAIPLTDPGFATQDTCEGEVIDGVCVTATPETAEDDSTTRAPRTPRAARTPRYQTTTPEETSTASQTSEPTTRTRVRTPESTAAPSSTTDPTSKSQSSSKSTSESTSTDDKPTSSTKPKKSRPSKAAKEAASGTGGGDYDASYESVSIAENMATLPPCVTNVDPVNPKAFTISSKFGMRDGEFHRGVDLAAKTGTPIVAAMDGVVSAAGPAAGFGQWIVIDSMTAAGPVSTVYGHMYPKGVLVKKGQEVKVGEQIGNVGSNGQSTGPHLHFEIWAGGRFSGGKAIDPLPVVRAQSNPDSPVAVVADAIANCALGSALKAGSVPDEFAPWLRKAGATCPGIGAPLLAAQLEAENGFRYGANAPVSSSGARGPAQFMPGTWKTWGTDADGDGKVDINSIADAVISQAKLMCHNYELTSAGVQSGELTGDPIDLALAAYNAGFHRVQQFHGMPRGGEFTTQTQPYVKKIRARERAFRSLDTAALGPEVGEAILNAARKADGLPYQWGGGNVRGATRGGFDAPGLVAYAVYQGTEGKVTVARSTHSQWLTGTDTPLDQARAGDLIFSGFDKRGKPTRVAIAVDGENVIAATSDTGVVTVPMPADAKVRRIG